MSPIGERARVVMVSLSVLLGVFSAATGTWMASAQGNTAELGAAALVLPNEPAGAGAGTGAGLAGRQVQTTARQPTTAAPTTSSAAPTPTETSSETPKPTTSEAAPPPPSTTAPAPVAPSTAAQVISLVNDQRAKAGCKPLDEESHLTKAAQDYSDDMAARNFFSHTNPEGVTFDQRIKNDGYAKPGAENIAKGQTSAAQVMDAWMNSDGHRANILNCSLTKIGVGVTTKGWYWVQDFGY